MRIVAHSVILHRQCLLLFAFQQLSRVAVDSGAASALLGCILGDGGACTVSVIRIALFALGTLATHKVCKDAILEQATKVSETRNMILACAGSKRSAFVLVRDINM